MPMTAGQLEQMIRTALPDAEVEITDLRGDGDHYAAHVVSKTFIGKTRVQQHQMVYDALGGGMGDTLHALALQTSVPDDA
ncbi:MAG TPA: BolA family transcriptional regulator [Rhodobiaceae bacterium]|jgi:stress-induced morphogen|nr:BolA family transcriptional regulator [Rhodobiaceae bacterium]|tara:strand:+ start:587 stop:826 length:240 start_codon:yes stop_codon:yes gene_type:complete